jgi:methionyl-tRNA synthetase
MANPSTSTERFYLTTPIYYVNARPHLGHAYSTIVCDAIARRKRALGIETWFLTGTDEHGQKIERSAKDAGRTPQEFATAIAGEFRALWDQLGITYDDFIRTTEPRHVQGMQKLFVALRQRGYIYKGSYTGQYCVSDEAWVDVPPGAPCPDCGRITETVSEENYFFKLSAFERKLLEFYEANPGFMQPESTRREVIYITAIGYGSEAVEDREKFKKFWPANIHLIGKEISRFHCVYWPAFLMAAGIPVQHSVRANGWLLFDQGKMSKSRGNVVRAETVQAVLGADALRYFLLREIPFGQDGNFSFDALVQRYNGDLANGYGNLVSRVVNMMHKFFGGTVPEAGAETPAEIALREHATRAITEFGPAFDDLNFFDALKNLWLLVAETDGYLTANAPWKKPADRSDADHTALQARVLANAAQAIRIITALVYPILPDAAAKVWRQLGQGEIADAAKQSFLSQVAWGGLKAGIEFGEPAPLFPRAEKDAIERMQNLEDENNRTAVEAASQSAGKTLPAAPAPPTASPSVASTTSTNVADIKANEKLTQTTATSPHMEKPVETTTVHQVPADVTSSRLSSTPAPAASGQPATSETMAAPQVAVATESAAPEGASPVIAIDDFGKVELRVAQVLVAERIPKADKLLRLEVDLGYEKRQILAGIAQYYEPEKLIGRKIVIVANLAPRKMRGLESNGMLLAASLPDGAPVLASFLEEVPLGARLK